MRSDAVIVICSRPQSKRLPGKVFKRIAGLSVLEHILKRVSGHGIPIIVAVPQGEADGYLPYEARYPEVTIFQGVADSPLHRMAAAVMKLRQPPTYIVRITHDDAIIDAQSMVEMIAMAHEKDASYVWAPDIVEGAGVEVIDLATLLSAANNHKEPTEFISYFVRGVNPAKEFVYRPRPAICRTYRMTLDYPADAQFLEVVLRKLGALASCDDICRFIDQRPWLLAINHLPTVSLYTCAYNAEPFVSEAMQTVLHNGAGFFEYIVVDDGSTDNTLLEIAKFATDPRLKVIINERNIGLAASSNVAISAACGKYVMRLDADDKLLHGAVERMIDYAEQHGFDAVYPGYVETDESGDFTMTAGNWTVTAGSVHHHAGGTLFKRSVLNDIRFRDGLRHYDSLELYKRLQGRFKIGYWEHPAFFYRRHHGSMSLNHLAEREAIRRRIIEGD